MHHSGLAATPEDTLLFPIMTLRLSPIETLAQVKSRQVTEKNSCFGIDCTGKDENGKFSCRFPPGVFDVDRHEEAVHVRFVDLKTAMVSTCHTGMRATRFVIPD